MTSLRGLYGVKAPVEISRLVSAVGVESGAPLPGVGLYLGNVISPVFDWLKLRETYPDQFLDAMEISTTGDKVLFTTPDGMRWVVVGISWAVKTGNFTASFLRVGRRVNSAVGWNVPLKQYSSAQSDYGWFPANPIPMDPGDTIILSINALTAAGALDAWALVSQQRAY